MTTDTKQLLERISRLAVAPIADVLRIKGFRHQVLHHTIMARSGDRITGVATTVTGSVNPGGGALSRSDLAVRCEMFRRVGSDGVLVMASGGYRDAVVFGANVALAARAKGCLGIVTDGGVRDVAELRQSGVAVFATFQSPLSGGGQWRITEVDEKPAIMPGQSNDVPVHPGDIVRGDLDGVVIVPAAHLAEVTRETEELCRIEEEISRELTAGRDPEDVYAAFDRFSHIRRLT